MLKEKEPDSESDTGVVALNEDGSRGAHSLIGRGEWEMNSETRQYQ